MALAPEQVGIGIRRHFTEPGVHPYDTVEWERRNSHIPNWKDGTDAFRQDDVEFPVSWSQNAINIVAQKYFRGTLGTDERETSLRQVIDRVADTITSWGVKDGYFTDESEGDAFRDELKSILVTQRAAFNSPVWFNIGVKGRAQQASACFILAVDDTMDAILNWYTEEGMIFKGGSGSGINLSDIRSSQGTARQERRHRQRSAELYARRRCVGRRHQERRQDPPGRQDGHPERRPPRRRGVHLVQGHRRAQGPRPRGRRLRHGPRRQRQLTRSSTRTPTTRCASPTSSCTPSSTTTTGTCGPSRPARSARPSRPASCSARSREAAWECADPGMQFDTTINSWHTTPNAGRINGSQPVLRVHAPRQLGLQPGQHQPAEVPRRRRHLRRRSLQAHRRGDVHRPGNPGRLRRLPDREDRREQPAVPPARPRATPTSAPC